MDRVKVLAHRGARAAAPENTIDAFVLAAALGADGVELDARRTADGGLVVNHDAAAAGVGLLCELTQVEIRARRPDMPTLVEALDACTGFLVNIEIKNLAGDPDFDPDERAAAVVVEILHERGGTDEVIVSSFGLGAVDRVHALDPSIPTGLLLPMTLDPLDGVALAADRGHRAVHPGVWSLAGPVADAVAERAHELRLEVNVWTVNDPDEMRRLAAAGVDTIITDVPDIAKAALA